MKGDRENASMTIIDKIHREPKTASIVDRNQLFLLNQPVFGKNGAPIESNRGGVLSYMYESEPFIDRDFLL
jgi:hypothetical protein